MGKKPKMPAERCPTRVRQLREAKKLSTVFVAGKIKRSTQNLGQIETGERDLSTDLAGQIARLFEVEVGALYWRREPGDRSPDDFGNEKLKLSSNDGSPAGIGGEKVGEVELPHSQDLINKMIYDEMKELKRRMEAVEKAVATQGFRKRRAR